MRPNFYVWEYFHHKLATLVTPPTNGTVKHLVLYKVHLVLWHQSKTASKSIRNWRRYLSSNWYKIDRKTRF